MMRWKVLLLMAAAALMMMMPPAESVESASVVSLRDVLKVFREIVVPYEEKKSLRNNEIDRQVDGVVQQMSRINPDLDVIHNLLRNLSADIPVFERNFKKPLEDVQGRVKYVIEQLNKCARQPAQLQITPTPSSSEEVPDSEEITELEPQVEPVDHELAEHENVVLQHQTAAFRELLSPVRFDNSVLSAILEMYDTNSTVTLRDAADAFKMVADLISQEHRNRFVSLIPNIKKAKKIVSNISNHLIGIKVDLEKVSGRSSELYRTSQVSVDEVNTISRDLLRVANGIVC